MRAVTLWESPRGILKFKQTLPDELVAAAIAAGGKKSYTRTLGVRESEVSKSELVSLCQREWETYEAYLSSLRHGPQPLSWKQIQQYVGRWYAHVLEAYSENPHSLKQLETLAQWFGPKEGKPMQVRTSACAEIAAEIIKEHRLSPDADSRATLEKAIGHRLESLANSVFAMMKGDYSADPVLKQFPTLDSTKVSSGAPVVTSKAVQAGITFDLMLDRWENAKRGRNPTTVRDYRNRVTKFTAHLLVNAGHQDPARVETEDVIRWRDSLAATSTKTATIQRKFLAALSAVFAASVQGVGAGRLAANPVSSAFYSGKEFGDSEDILPYAPGHVAGILRSARKTDAPEYRWLPWLLAHSGLRIREATQSLASDVREKDGVWYFDVNANQNFKRLKVTASKREVPIHPALDAEGFIKYAQSLAPDAFLFPVLQPKPDGSNKSGRPAERWRNWVSSHCIVPVASGSKYAPAHSFRHLFQDLLREATDDAELRERLLGHAVKGSAADYGNGHALKKKAEAVSRIPAFTV